MLRLKSGARGEHLTSHLWCVKTRLKVTCLRPIYPVNGLFFQSILGIVCVVVVKGMGVGQEGA